MSSETESSNTIAGESSGRVVDRLRPVTGPIDRALSPLANGYNRFLGPYFGEMNGLQFALLFVSLISLATAPFWSNYIIVQTFTVASIWAIFAMSWDIQSGYTGYISFGHSALSGAAAYTTAMLLYNVGDFPFMVTAPVSVFVTLVVGLAIALPSLRLSGPYFSLITFVAVLIFYRLIRPFSDQTGGETGLQSVEVFTYDPVALYYYMFVPMVVIAVVLVFIARSNIGLVFTAIRENESAVEAAGLNATKFKLWSFVISAIPMGIGGVLLAHYYGGVDPYTFVVVDNSIEMIAMAVVGGMSSILGPLAGAFLFLSLDRIILTELPTRLRWIIIWVAVLVVLVFARDGVFRKLWHGLDRLGGDRE
ncbi:branched-chain amino acid ABC transporter permease [Haloterrigena alkaliphila]|uniref:Branched-chain amino acid ABC transporter permease n=1 Tax=Haloterrigena alkaliphila TaxID=2816475 RepID=A0A8A2VB82_9EURY|nr:branched-chain amino acid ABC transporter permease [Haloterrigena alkaliphila]QSW98396.1 branched-chain amino acid ABC transporter permease [Haloterrigena alkaliphila]